MYGVLVVASGVLLGMSAGVFYGFSSFVMSGLDRADDHAAGVAMTGINETAVRPAFMDLFFGALLVTALTAAVGLIADDDGAGRVLAAAILYLVGAIGVTIARNVPLNERLVRADDKAAAWRVFHRPWTAWNHVRTICAAVAAVLATTALL